MSTKQKRRRRGHKLVPTCAVCDVPIRAAVLSEGGVNCLYASRFLAGQARSSWPLYSRPVLEGWGRTGPCPSQGVTTGQRTLHLQHPRPAPRATVTLEMVTQNHQHVKFTQFQTLVYNGAAQAAPSGTGGQRRKVQHSKQGKCNHVGYCQPTRRDVCVRAEHTHSAPAHTHPRALSASHLPVTWGCGGRARQRNAA